MNSEDCAHNNQDTRVEERKCRKCKDQISVLFCKDCKEVLGTFCECDVV
jgi:hypothetical protein